MMTGKVEARRWAAPVFGVVAGVVLAGIFLARDDPASALGTLALMVGYCSLLVLGRRYEVIGLLGSGDPDERRDEIARRASLFAGYTVLTVILGAFVWELAHGRDGTPYAQLGGLGGVAFIAGVIWYRRKL